MAKESKTSTLDVPLKDLGERLTAMRLCSPAAQQSMQLSLSRVGQLSPILAYRVGERLEVFDGLKRLRAARELSWPTLRAEVHLLDSAGAKLRLLCCNAGTGLAELEEAWLVRSLYREDGLSQPRIAMLLSRHKSWVCRRLALAEGLSDELTASVRLGLISVRAAVELARLPRGNQDEAMQVVTRRGLTTRQTTSLVQSLLASPEAVWTKVLEEASTPVSPPPAKGGAPRRTPAEQIVADAWGMKRSAARLHTRLLERSLTSLGEAAAVIVSRELGELHSALGALSETIETRFAEQGESNAA